MRSELINLKLTHIIYSVFKQQICEFIFLLSYSLFVFSWKKSLIHERNQRINTVIAQCQIVIEISCAASTLSLMSTLTLMYGCAWTLTSPHWQSHRNQIVKIGDNICYVLILNWLIQISCFCKMYFILRTLTSIK